MITRIWHGETKPENEEAYLKLLSEEGTNEYRQTAGNLSAKIWKKSENASTHFWTVTEWENLDSIKKFAGEDFEKARYYPADSGMLLRLEEHVEHYETYDVSNTKIKHHIYRLEQTLHGGNWLAESFDGKLAHLAEHEAFASPAPGIHSVAEIVWHCIYWRKVTRKRLEGDNRYREETIEKLNWLSLDELKKMGWEQIKRGLSETQADLIAYLHEKNDLFLEKEYQPGYTHEFLIEGTIQHDIYHLGQVGLVLKMVRAIRQ